MPEATNGGLWRTALAKVTSEPGVLSVVALFVVCWRWPSGGDKTSLTLCVLLIVFAAGLMTFQFIKYRSLTAARRAAPLISAQILGSIDAHLEGDEPDPRGPIYDDLAGRFAYRAVREEEPYSTLLRHVSEELRQAQQGYGDPEDFVGPVES